MNATTKYLAGVLTVIALGVTVIAYNLVVPRASLVSAAAVDPSLTTAPVSVVEVRDTLRPAQAVPVGTRVVERVVVREVPASSVHEVAEEPMVVRPVRTVQTVQTVDADPAPRRVVTRTVEREHGRDWKRTAMVIGGSTAAGAGVGGIFGGKKGALIGAAIAGGVSTIQQTR